MIAIRLLAVYAAALLLTSCADSHQNAYETAQASTAPGQAPARNPEAYRLRGAPPDDPQVPLRDVSPPPQPRQLNAGVVTFQDLTNEACAPSHYLLLPPCGNNITIEELNNRLQYKLKMTEMEDEQWNNAISSWKRTLGLLYVEPTQRNWDLSKKIAMQLSTDLIRGRLSEAIDAEGAAFLAGANGDVELVRKHILWFLISNGFDKSSIATLEASKIKIDHKSLFRVQLPR